MGEVIPDIISNDQVGFIKDRRVSTLLRLVDDVMDNLNMDDKPGLLVSIDYSQAFDRISKELMITAFKMFGFGPDFIKWVQVLMTNTLSSISYCGWTSEYFQVDSGIRQGCPFSPLAFVVGIELLAIKLRNSKNIKGIKLGCSENPVSDLIKVALYADDVTLFLTDLQDLKYSLEVIQEFSLFSGLVINQSKSVAMWLGSKKNNNERLLGFQWKKRIKILGIYFMNDRPASQIEDNWSHRIETIQRLIHSWEKRDLSIMGKICVIKTFLISQLVYIMQALVIPDKILTDINRLFFRFLWRKQQSNRRAFEKVKRSVVCSEFDQGGLKMIDIRQMQAAFLLQWAVKLSKSKDSEKWSLIPSKLFLPLGINYTCFYSNTSSSDFKDLKKIPSQFWKTVLKTWLDLNKHDNKPPYSTLLWNNKFITYQGKVLYFSEWIQGKIVQISDVYGPNGILTYNEICDKIGHSPGRILQYNVVSSAIRLFVSKVRDEDRKDLDLSTSPSFCSKMCSSCSDFRTVLCEVNYTEPCSNRFWRNKFGFDLDKDNWKKARQCTKETRLRVLQWKILHNIYPTNIMLCKMKIKDSQNCSYCRNEIDYIEHFFIHCPVVKAFWKEVSQYILTEFDVQIYLADINVLLGVWLPGIDSLTVNRINHIVLVAKMCISIYKKTESKIPLFVLFYNHVRLRKI